jgi:glycosyltransferase involved in cell wall biosynthesis
VERSDVVALDAALAKSWSGTWTVLSVGRLDPEKNPLLLLDVAERLRDHDARWRLVIAGDGPLRPELERQIQQRRLANVVELLGEVPNGTELWGLYRRCQAFLHVSLTEGLPQVLFEAQAAGVPIVATDVGGVRAALLNGTTGLLVPPRDAPAVVTALRRIAESAEMRRQLIVAALEHVADHTLEAQLDRITAFIADTTAP